MLWFEVINANYIKHMNVKVMNINELGQINRKR